MNSQNDINNIVRYTEEMACHMNPGPTAVRVGNHLNENYMLINRDDLPEINHGSIDDAFSGSTPARLTNVTEKTFGGDTAKMRDLALQYLVMADYIDGQKKLDEEKALTALRVEAWLLIHPLSGMTVDKFGPVWKNADPLQKSAVEAVVSLKRQLAEAQKKS